MASTYQQRKESKARKALFAERQKQTAAEDAARSAAQVTAHVAVDPDFPEEMGDAVVKHVPIKAPEFVVATHRVKLPVPVTGSTMVRTSGKPGSPVGDAAILADALAVSVVDPAAAFSAWLASPQGLDCTDPRCPSDPLRKRADMETRLKLAFIAGMGVASGTGGLY